MLVSRELSATMKKISRSRLQISLENAFGVACSYPKLGRRCSGWINDKYSFWERLCSRWCWKCWINRDRMFNRSVILLKVRSKQFGHSKAIGFRKLLKRSILGSRFAIRCDGMSSRFSSNKKKALVKRSYRT